jgi:hypothetical protein
MVSTQPREDNWGATWNKNSGSGLENQITTVGIRCADHATPSISKSWHYFANKRRSLSRIVRSRTKATEFSFSLVSFLFLWFPVIGFYAFIKYFNKSGILIVIIMILITACPISGVELKIEETTSDFVT